MGRRSASGDLPAIARWPETTLDEIGQPLVLVDRRGRVLVANEAARSRFPGGVLDSGSAAFLDLLTDGRAEALLAEVEANGEAHVEAHPVVGGRLSDLEVSLYATSEPAPGAVAVTVGDASRRREAERQRDAAERGARQIFDAAPVGLMRLLPDGRITDVNRALEELFGMAARQLIGLTPADVTTHVAGDRFRLPGTRSDAAGETLIRFCDQREAWVRWTSRALTTAAGAPTAIIVSALDVSGLRAENRRRLASEQHARQLFEHAPVGIVTLDAELRITSANPAFSRLVECELDNVLGQAPQAFLIPGDATESPDSGFADLVSGARASASGEQRVRTGKGQARWLAWSAARMPERLNGDDYIVAVADTSAQHEAEAARAATLERVRELDSLKTQFVSMVGHEFRTALTGIQGFSELMRDEAFTADELRGLAADINVDAQRLTRLVNDLLDLDRMAAGQMTLHRSEFEVHAAVCEVIERFRSSSARNTWVVDVPPGRFVADRDKVTQLLANLLGNATKYAPGAEVRVTARIEGGGIHLAVADNGPGIASEELERIFERYARVEGWATRGVGGTGLGLPIVREIARLHGGDAWAESRPGEGVTFHVTLAGEEAR